MTNAFRRATVALVALLALGLAAPAASAHAVLVSTDPAAGAVLDRAPAAVTLRFGEAVEASFGAIRVYDANARRVDDGAVGHPGGHGNTVAVGLRPLTNGAYVVTWRVVSADSHPVHGAFTFQVGRGAAGNEQALAARLLAQQGGSALVGGVFAVVRWLAFASLVVLVGGAAFVLTCLRRNDSRAVRILTLAAAGVVVTAVLGIALQGPYAAALPLRDAARPAVLRAVLDTRFGHAWAARALLGLAALALVRPVLRGRLVAAGAAAGVALLGTLAAAGHASVGSLVPLVLASDVLHLAAVSFWLGGLVLLAACVLPRDRAGDAGEVVARFSPLAFAAVVVIVVTGTFQSWREVGSFGALTGTTYGHLLIAKVAGFTVLVALGSVGRRWVRGRATGDLAAVRRSVGLEVVVAAAVLALTALLVNAAPARTAYARPFTATLTSGDVSVNVVISRAKAGRTDVHVYTLTTSGGIREVAELTGDLRLPAREIGPLVVPFTRAGPGHFAAYAVDVPIPGRWVLDLTVRTSDIDQTTVSTTVRFR
ncbi:MAG: copper transport protein [Frankiaceae bacterium]|nr:copper transport protein [Frankiaceae bacterium]